MKEQKARREQFTQPQMMSSAPPAAVEASKFGLKRFRKI